MPVSSQYQNSVRTRVFVCKYIFLVNFCLVLFLFFPSQTCQASDAKWQAHVDVTAKLGYERSLGKLDFFIPLTQSTNTLLFANLRGVLANDPSEEGNFGLGFRRIQRDTDWFIGDWLWGVYGFYDLRRSKNNFNYTQGTFGVELMTEYFDVRANGYFPEDDDNIVTRRQSQMDETVLTGTQLWVHQENIDLRAEERPLPGYDIEAGYGLSFTKNHDLWTYVGYFHFDHSDTPVIEGPRFRMEYRWEEPFDWQGSRLSLGGEIQHDDIRGEQKFALIELRIPLGGMSSTPRQPLKGIDRRMTEQVVRDIDIVTFAEDINKPLGSEGGPTGINESSTDAVIDSSGDQINVYFIREGGSGDCSQAHPCDLTIVLADSQYSAGDAIILLDDGGAIQESITLLDRQQLVGGGTSGRSTLALGDMNTQLDLSNLGGRPQLNGGGADAVILASGNTIEGFSITGTQDGISANGITDVTVKDVVITNTGANALSFTNATGIIAITDSSATDSTEAGLMVSGGAASYTYTNFDISDTNSGRSLDIQNTTGGSMVFDAASSITNSGGSGIWVNNIGGDITFNNHLTVTGATSDAVTLTSLGTSTISINNGITVTTTNGKGLVGSGGTLNINTGSLDSTNGMAYDLDSISLDINFTCLRTVTPPGVDASVTNSDGTINSSGNDFDAPVSWTIGARAPGLTVNNGFGTPCP